MWAEVLAQLVRIFYFVVCPMLLLAGIGAALQRVFGLDQRTLTCLNFYFIVPAMVYTSIVSSTLDGGEVLRVALFAFASQALMAGVTLVAVRLRRLPRPLHPAAVMTTIYNNSGNYGMPLQDLAFRSTGLADSAMGLQTFVMVAQNVSTFTVGVVLAATGRGPVSWRANVGHILKFPPIYALAAAAATVALRHRLAPGTADAAQAALFPAWNALLYGKGAFVGLALLTLGAQLAGLRPGGNRQPVSLSVFLRLCIAPALALALIRLFGIHGFAAQVLLIGSSTPTAVNSMLLCMEFDNHPDYAARAVFYSTLLSPFTVTAVIFLSRLVR